MGKHELLADCWSVECSSTEKLVLLCLAHHLNSATGQCNPSQARIAALTGLTDRSVRKAMASLTERGLIRTLRHGRAAHCSFSISRNEVPVRPERRSDQKCHPRHFDRPSEIFGDAEEGDKRWLTDRQ